MTADSFCTVLASFFYLKILKNTNEREREVTPPTIHTILRSKKLHWHLGINFIMTLRLQIASAVIVESGNCKFENGLVFPQITSNSLNTTKHKTITSCLTFRIQVLLLLSEKFDFSTHDKFKYRIRLFLTYYTTESFLMQCNCSALNWFVRVELMRIEIVFMEDGFVISDSTCKFQNKIRIINSICYNVFVYSIFHKMH